MYARAQRGIPAHSFHQGSWEARKLVTPSNSLCPPRRAHYAIKGPQLHYLWSTSLGKPTAWSVTCQAIKTNAESQGSDSSGEPPSPRRVRRAGGGRPRAGAGAGRGRGARAI